MWSDARITSASSSPTGIQWTMPYPGQYVIVGLTTANRITSYPLLTHAIYFQTGSTCVHIASGTWGTSCSSSCYTDPATEWKIQAVSASSLDFSYRCPGGDWVVWKSQSWNGQVLRAGVDIYSSRADCQHGPRGVHWI